MPCACVRVALTYKCLHIKIRNHPCYFHEVPFLSCCLPRSKPRHRQEKAERICRDCHEYFRNKYGKRRYRKYVKYFLDYKASRGLHARDVNPWDVPHEVLVDFVENPDQQDSGFRGQGHLVQMDQPMRQEIYGLSMLQPMPAYVKAERQRALDASNRRRAQSSSEEEEEEVKNESQAKPRGRRRGRGQEHEHGNSNGKDPSPTTNEPMRHGPHERAPSPVGMDITSHGADPGSLSRSPSPLAATYIPGASTLQRVKRLFYYPSMASFDSVKKPTPVIPSVFVVGEDEDEQETEVQHRDRYKNHAVKNEDPPSATMADRPRHPYSRTYLEPKYQSGDLPPGHVVPDLAHLATPGGQPQQVRTPELQHPKPKAAVMGRRLRKVDSMSDITIVKRLTEAAKAMEEPDGSDSGQDCNSGTDTEENVGMKKENDKGKGKGKHIEYQPGKFVPVLSEPPRGRRRHRASYPKPTLNVSVNVEDKEQGISQNIPIVLSPQASTSEVPQDTGMSFYERLLQGDTECVTGYIPPSSTSPTNSPKYMVCGLQPMTPITIHRSPSPPNVLPPPHRPNGVLIPAATACPTHGEYPDSSCGLCQGTLFQERGIPSSTHMKEEIRSATLPRPVVSTCEPRRRYSCAVQSCYCNNETGSKNEQKCPSCQEREKIAKEHNVNWI